MADLPRSIRDLDLDGKRVFVRVDFNVPASRTASCGTTRASSRRCPRSTSPASAAPASSSRRTSARRRARATRSTRSRPWRARSRRASAPPSPSPPTASARRRRRPSPRFAPGRRPRPREPAFSRRAKRATTRRSAGSSRPSPRSTSTTRSGRPTARTPRRPAWRRLFAKDRRGIGLLMERELKALARVVTEIERPFAAILGGAKISASSRRSRRSSRRPTSSSSAGGMANHFVAALGLPVGGSLLEKEGVPVARQIIDRCKERGVAARPAVRLRRRAVPREGRRGEDRGDERDPRERAGLRHRAEDASRCSAG